MKAALSPTGQGLGWVVRHRPLTGGRWKVVATVGTHAEAVDCINAAGDWWIGRQAVEPAAEPIPVRKPKPVLAAEATPNLFG